MKTTRRPFLDPLKQPAGVPSYARQLRQRINTIQRSPAKINLTTLITPVTKKVTAQTPLPTSGTALFTGGWKYNIVTNIWSLTGNPGDDTGSYAGYFTRSVPGLSLYINGAGTGFWVSTNAGRSWAEKNLPGAGGPGVFNDIDVADDLTIWTSAFNGSTYSLYYSDDLGDTWVMVETLGSFSSYDALSVGASGNQIVMLTTENTIPFTAWDSHVFLIDKAGVRTGETLYAIPPNDFDIVVGWAGSAPVYGHLYYDSAAYPAQGASANIFYRWNGASWGLVLTDAPTGAHYTVNSSSNWRIQDGKIWILLMGNFNGENRFYEYNGTTVTAYAPTVLAADVGETFGIRAFGNEYFFKSDATFIRGDGLVLAQPSLVGPPTAPWPANMIQVLQ